MKQIILIIGLFISGCTTYIVKDCPCPNIEGYVWNYSQNMGDSYPKWRYEPIDTLCIYPDWKQLPFPIDTVFKYPNRFNDGWWYHTWDGDSIYIQTILD